MSRTNGKSGGCCGVNESRGRGLDFTPVAIATLFAFSEDVAYPRYVKREAVKKVNRYAHANRPSGVDTGVDLF